MCPLADLRHQDLLTDVMAEEQERIERSDHWIARITNCVCDPDRVVTFRKFEELEAFIEKTYYDRLEIVDILIQELWPPFVHTKRIVPDKDTVSLTGSPVPIRAKVKKRKTGP